MVSVKDANGSKQDVASALVAGSASVHRNINVDHTFDLIKTGAGRILGGLIFNVNAAIRYLKIYDEIASPTGYSRLEFTLALPANGIPVEIPASVCAHAFSVGIGIRATTGVADSDNGEPSANDVIANIIYE